MRIPADHDTLRDFCLWAFAKATKPYPQSCYSLKHIPERLLTPPAHYFAGDFHEVMVECGFRAKDDDDPSSAHYFVKETKPFKAAQKAHNENGKRISLEEIRLQLTS